MHHQFDHHLIHLPMTMNRPPPPTSIISIINSSSNTLDDHSTPTKAAATDIEQRHFIYLLGDLHSHQVTTPTHDDRSLAAMDFDDDFVFDLLSPPLHYDHDHDQDDVHKVPTLMLDSASDRLHCSNKQYTCMENTSKNSYASGTLESIVNQSSAAASTHDFSLDDSNWLVPPSVYIDDQDEHDHHYEQWLNDHDIHHHTSDPSDAAPPANGDHNISTTTLDALVPCLDLTCDTVDPITAGRVIDTCLLGMRSTTIDHDRDPEILAHELVWEEEMMNSNFHTLRTDTCQEEDRIMERADTLGLGYSEPATSHTKIVHHLEAGENREGKKRKFTKGSSRSSKRFRIPAIHNQSERIRRGEINHRLKALHRLVPNSHKTDKASMLGEVIVYVKQLQAQVDQMKKMMMTTIMPYMMMPYPMTIQQQQLHMSMMAAQMAGLSNGGLGITPTTMDINSMIMSHHHQHHNHHNNANGNPTVVVHPTTVFNPYMSSWPYHYHQPTPQNG